MSSYETAVKMYEDLGIEVEKGLKQLQTIPLSLHCWQGDDVQGFESHDASLQGSGLVATGNFLGRARNIKELRKDLRFALSLIPGNHRVNLHAIYGDFAEQRVERTDITIEHFQSWVDWAIEQNLGLDFNPTLFSHPKSASGFTLSSKNKDTREFWITHVARCREISSEIGKQLKRSVINNLWIPDGTKDIPVDKGGHRKLLKEALDEIYEKKYSKDKMKDAIEGKLFGIGSESFVVGSHDFYSSYAIQNDLILTMDTGHFHPTESVADKVSALLPFMDELLIHVSRGVRWDSDHVVIMSPELTDITGEIVKNHALNRVHLALDYFDASINRIGAWVIGARATLKSMLYALLQPWKTLIEYEENQQNFQRLALLEEMKTMPYGTIWEHYCIENSVPGDRVWINQVEEYEKSVLGKRT